MNGFRHVACRLLLLSLVLCIGCTAEQNSVIDTSNVESVDNIAYDEEMIELARGQAE